MHFVFFAFLLVNHFTAVSRTRKELGTLDDCPLGSEIIPHQSFHHFRSLLPSLCVIFVHCYRIHATQDEGGGRWESGSPRLPEKGR